MHGSFKVLVVPVGGVRVGVNRLRDGLLASDTGRGNDGIPCVLPGACRTVLVDQENVLPDTGRLFCWP